MQELHAVASERSWKRQAVKSVYHRWHQPQDANVAFLTSHAGLAFINKLVCWLRRSHSVCSCGVSSVADSAVISATVEAVFATATEL